METAALQHRRSSLGFSQSGGVFLHLIQRDQLDPEHGAVSVFHKALCVQFHPLTCRWPLRCGMDLLTDLLESNYLLTLSAFRVVVTFPKVVIT